MSHSNLFVKSISTLILLAFAAGQVAYAQSEEKTFSTNVPSASRASACANAKEAAQEWLKANTDKNHPYFLANQAKRRWPAKSEGSSACACSQSDGKHECTVDAKISAI